MTENKTTLTMARDDEIIRQQCEELEAQYDEVTTFLLLEQMDDWLNRLEILIGDYHDA
jgi:hypothetical protein